MNAHPHGEHLSAYLDGMLDVAKTHRVAAHLGVCAPCRELCDGLRQTRDLLRGLPVPAQPAPQFWADAYRRMRVEERQHTPRHVERGDWLQSPQRRWSAGLAAAAVLAGLIAAPQMQVPQVHPSSVVVAEDTVDVSSLVRSHTESAGRQPLADPDRQDMIAMDDSLVGDDLNAPPGGGGNAGDAAP